MIIPRTAGLGDPAAYVTLLNPISPERSSLRRSILSGILEATASNLRFRERVALFELGRVFHPRPGAVNGLPDEPRRLGIVLTGPAVEMSWRDRSDRVLDFYDVKGAVECLLEALGIAATWRAGSHPSLHPGRTAEVTLGEVLLGHVGELHPVVREQWDLGERPVAVADLDLDALQSVAGRLRPFVPFSAYPTVHRDLAVAVAESVRADEVAAVIRRVGGPLLVDLRLFDIYRGAQAGEGRKSLAWTLVFQAADKTLEGKVVDGFRERIVAALVREVGAERR